MSTDPAHSLGRRARRASSAREPVEVGPRLWAQQITAQDELERNWAAVQDWAGEMLVERGVDRITADELTVPPGADELFALLAIKRHHESGEFDVVVVDCAPTGETLRLLSFPDVARWWLEKVFPQQGRILDAARPFARAVLDVQLPGEAVLDDVQKLVAQPDRDARDPPRPRARLAAARDEPRPHGHRRGAADVHVPEPLRLPHRRGRRQPRVPRRRRRLLRGVARDASSEAIAEVDAAFAPVPVLQRAVLRAARCAAAEMLDRLGDALFDGRDAGATCCTRSFTQGLVVGRDGASLRLELPFADKGELQLQEDRRRARRARRRRTSARCCCPPALAGYRPSGATFEDDALVITFDAPVEAVASDA